MNRLPVAVAQLNFTVGDVDKNVDSILHAADSARSDLGCRVVIFPELSITGYPPEDLLFREIFSSVQKQVSTGYWTQKLTSSW